MTEHEAARLPSWLWDVWEASGEALFVRLRDEGRIVRNTPIDHRPIIIPDSFGGNGGWCAPWNYEPAAPMPSMLAAAVPSERDASRRLRRQISYDPPPQRVVDRDLERIRIDIQELIDEETNLPLAEDICPDIVVTVPWWVYEELEVEEHPWFVTLQEANGIEPDPDAEIWY